MISNCRPFLIITSTSRPILVSRYMLIIVSPTRLIHGVYILKGMKFRLGQHRKLRNYESVPVGRLFLFLRPRLSLYWPVLLPWHSIVTGISSDFRMFIV